MTHLHPTTIEWGNIMGRYLFTVRKKPFGVTEIDSFFEIPDSDIPPHLNPKALAVANELKRSNGDKNLYGRETQQFIVVADLRSRYNNDIVHGVFYVTTEDFELERNDLEQYLRSLDKRNELESFLENARLTYA